MGRKQLLIIYSVGKPGGHENKDSEREAEDEVDLQVMLGELGKPRYEIWWILEVCRFKTEFDVFTKEKSV